MARRAPHAASKTRAGRPRFRDIVERMQRVFVVDDSPLVRSMLRAMLGSVLPEGQLILLSNGLEAMARIEQDGEPDLMLVDINMPEMDGLEFLQALRGRGVLDRVPVIIVSTEQTPQDIERGLAAGARAYLGKPFDAKQLGAAVEKVMGQKNE